MALSFHLPLIPVRGETRLGDNFIARGRPLLPLLPSLWYLSCRLIYHHPRCQRPTAYLPQIHSPHAEVVHLNAVHIILNMSSPLIKLDHRQQNWQKLCIGTGTGLYREVVLFEKYNDSENKWYSQTGEKILYIFHLGVF